MSLFTCAHAAFPVFHLFRGCDDFHRAVILNNGLVMIRRHWWRFVSQYWLLYIFLTLSQGLSCSNLRACAKQYGQVPQGIPRLLLHCTSKLTYIQGPWQAWCCARRISSLPHGLYWGWCSDWHISSTTTCSQTLSTLHPSIWIPEWSLFIHHWVKTYRSSQKAMASIKQV